MEDLLVEQVLIWHFLVALFSYMACFSGTRGNKGSCQRNGGRVSKIEADAQ